MTQRRRNPAPRPPAGQRPRRRGPSNRSSRRPPAPRRGRCRFHPQWLLVPAALLLWLLLSSRVFVVRNVEVIGAESMSTDAVVRASGIQLGSRLDSLNEGVIRSSIDGTGTLAFVQLERRYPVTVRLTVRERSRDAMILQTGKLLILDSDGYVVTTLDSAPGESLPYVTGLKPSTYRLGSQLDATPASLEAMKVVLEAMKAKHATPYCSELDLEAPTDIRIITRTGMMVLLGDAENMDRKIAWMVGALQDLERRGETLGRLDVSSGIRADYLPMVIATPTPAPTQNTYLLDTPTPSPTQTPAPDAEEGAVIGEDAI